MQLSKLFNTTNPNMKYIWFMFLPILIVVTIQYAVIIGDVAILFMKNILSDQEVSKDATVEFILSSDFKQPMNQAYMTLAQYVLYILVFGIWYYKAFCTDIDLVSQSNKPVDKAGADKINASNNPLLSYFKNRLVNGKTLLLILAGYAAQLFVDGILNLVAPLFTEQFEDYGKLVDTITGVSSSWVLLFAVIVVAPIGEELLFRGLIQSYGLKNFALVLAIGLQALIFGLYHGNMIQGIYAFFMGVILGFIAHRLGSLIPAMILHISINGSLLLVPEVLYDGTGRTIATTVVAGAVFAIMIWLVVRKQKENI